MRENLRAYIDRIFAEAPDCNRTREMKEEMLGNILERYDDLIREGKSEKEAYDISVAGIGDISELIASVKAEYGNVAESKKKEERQEKGVANTVRGILEALIWIATFTAYFTVSFATGMWNITWLMFLIAAAADNIVGAIFDLASGKEGRGGMITRLVIWAVVGATLLPLLVFGMNGDKPDWLHILGIYTAIDDDYHADSEEYQVGNAEYEEHIHSIDVAWEAGSVKFELWDGDTVKLEESGAGENERDFMRSCVKNGILTVKYSGQAFQFLDSRPRKFLTVYLPCGSAWQYKELSVQTASADIMLGCDGEELCVGFEEIGIDTASGDISIAQMFAQALEVDAASGSVWIGDQSFDSVDVDTASGDVVLEGSKIREAHIDCASGAINYYDAELEKGFFETSSGGIRLVSAEGVLPGRLEIDTVSGNVEIFLPDVKSGFVTEMDSVSGLFFGERTYGDGRAVYHFDTVSGNVSVSVSH